MTNKSKQAEPEEAGRKQESWFPVARKDLHKIRNAYVGAKADRLVWLWNILVGLSNKYNRQIVTIDLERLASLMGVSKRQTAKEALDRLAKIKLVSVARPTRGSDGRYKPSVITVKPTVPCTKDRQTDMDDHVRNRNALDRTVNNKGESKTPPVVIKKEVAAAGASLGCSPEAPLSGTAATSQVGHDGAYVGGPQIEAMLVKMDAKVGGSQ